MNPKFTHDFSSASVKHLIEAEFYKRVGELMHTKGATSTIVTGPDYQRHIDNHRKYIKIKNLTICEINTDIFVEIYKGCKSHQDVKVVNKSIELYGSSFIDCDLTCTSDLTAIKKTLLKQIEVQSSYYCNYKAFIMSFGLRTSVPKSLKSYIASILGLLGAHAQSVTIDKTESVYKSGGKTFCFKIKLSGSLGRIKEYICYEYNAGGGPMLTCLIIYK